MMDSPLRRDKIVLSTSGRGNVYEILYLNVTTVCINSFTESEYSLQIFALYL